MSAGTGPGVVDSPCISICTIDEKTEICTGCFRTLDEIGEWLFMTNDKRREVVAKAEARRLAEESNLT
ncbi:MAG: DUF1289 domain-containing protein [Pseudomonadota bacterium]